MSKLLEFDIDLTKFEGVTTAERTELETITARCDICSNSDTGTRQLLKDKGWELGPGYQFCPDYRHN